MLKGSFRCGPLAIIVRAQDQALHDKVADTLNLYDVAWPPPATAVHIDVRETDRRAGTLAGTYLECARMRVDATPAGLSATCRSGAHGAFSAKRQRWTITVPLSNGEGGVPEDVEDLVGLVLTTSWRRAGWVPMHAGAVSRGSCCAMLAAPSGGGKTTLITALIRRGWQALGDDKLLLKIGPGGQPQIRALLHNFNLHPKAREWFPEVGNLERLPPYSAWTEKRKVRIADIWPGRTSREGIPTHLVRIDRTADGRGIRVSAMEQGQVLSTLLRQTVMPNERRTVEQIIATVAGTAKGLRGVRVEVAADAYRDPACLEQLEAALS